MSRVGLTRSQLLATITDHYLAGTDFNGFPLRLLDPVPREQLDTLLTELVSAELISLNFATYHPNPHVKAFPPEPIDDQLQKLAELDDRTHLTAYPEAAHLKAVVDRDAYVDCPYTLALALGAAELMPRFFDLSVLEAYRNDPRYLYTTDDTSGHISVTDEFYESEHLSPSDRVVLETFGFAYNEQRLRAVCVFPVYLGRLTPEHQQIWAAKELGDGFFMHPAYRASAIGGEFPEKVSIFQAFTEELHQLQLMCNAVGLPHIVRRDFEAAAKPTNFGFLIRPTLKELQDFHAVLDKMMSDNLNTAFFSAEGLDLEREISRGENKVEIQRKGTIALLEEWAERILLPDPEPRDQMLAAFREVRKLRQRPAHAADDNRFDQRYFAEQHDLVIRAYSAVRALRLILTNYPGLEAYDGVPGWLYRGDIYTF